MADITPLKERPRFLAQLESVINITQCVGPLIAAVLSKIHLYVPLWTASGLYLASFIYAIFFLPESVRSVIEKKKLMATFDLIEREQKADSATLLDYGSGHHGN
ncbi:hypothetical protein BLSTO_06603 [Blastocystis sp. subtype 1]